MNIEKHLILVKDENKTEEIECCKYLDGKWSVTFRNNNTEYTYNYHNVVWHRNPKVINHQTHIVYESNQPLSGIVKILDFEDYLRILFKNGSQKIYRRSSVIIEENCLLNKKASNCFEYLKKLADHTGIKFEDDLSFLSKQYSRLTLTTINPRSVLAAYLVKKPLEKKSGEIQPIFPFGFNLSQKEATEKALSEQISVIEGPPGTGKTQTILNIITNALVDDKTVAVVSNNNSATTNVLEKLQKYDLDFIAAYLGNNDNKEKFFANQKNTYPDMSNWALPHSDYQSLKISIIQSQQKLNEMLESQNKLAVFKYELSELKTELEYFDRYYTETNGKPLKIHSIFKFNAEIVILLLLDYQRMIKKGKLSLIDKLYILFIYGIFDFAFYKNTPEEVISSLQKTFYDKKLKELNRNIESLTKKLENYNFDEAIKEYSAASMKFFKAKLAGKYKTNKPRTMFSANTFRNNFDRFIKEYPVILSTTHSLRNCVSENYLFDYLIIDEASQVDLVTGALALSCAKNAVIVGDTKQLPNVIPDEVEKITKKIFESFKLESSYSYTENSLLSSITNLYPDIPKTLLKEHYRCHPKIIGFCNRKFYNNQLVILTNEQDNDQPLVLYKTAKGEHARGRFNQRQIDVIFEEIIPEQNIDETKQSVGIISPFRLQISELKKTIGERNIEADTVHKYQGREKDVIILTTVANDVAVNDFVDDPNLVNVAVSRAVNKLVVVVSNNSEDWEGTNIRDLVRYIQYHNFEIIESQIYSVFDLLYSSYSEKLLKIMKNYKNVSEYKSENLMNLIIEKVLSEPEFQCLDRVIHQPLKMLIKDPSKLNDEECRYVMNVLTHTDFVIFNKLDKMPVLVVEVDGYAYHANNPKQLERDQMKDNILQKYDIPILRIKTNESGEEKKLRQRLSEILRLEL